MGASANFRRASVSAALGTATQHHRGGAALGLASVLAIALAAPAAAQNAPLVPTREQIEPPILSAPAERREQVVAAQDVIERAPCPLAAPEFSSIRFTLRAVQFSATGAIDTAPLDAVWRSYEGQELSLATVCEIRDRAATMLRSQGYLAAVQIPAQTINDGIVRFDVISARLSRIEVRGEAGPNAKLLQRYLAHLQDQPAFNIVDAERYLLLARDIPGMDARLTLRPGTVAGEVIGEVQVARMPYLFDFGLQNFGNPQVGRWSGVARAQIAGLTGMGDLTTLSFYATPDLEEQKVVQAAHEFRIGSEGLRVGGSYSYAWTRPDLGSLDLRSNAQIISLFSSYPIILSQARRLTGSGGLDIINQDVRLATIPLNKDRLRVLHAKLDASWTDPSSITGRNGFSPAAPHWYVQSSLEARKGLAGLGASDTCGLTGAGCIGSIPTTRAEGKADAFLLRAAALAEVRPQQAITLAAQIRGQLAFDPLLSYEEFSGGNYTIGRGYDSGAVIGDSGLALGLEARYATGLRVGKKRYALDPYVFFDSARVWNKDAAFRNADGQQLHSTGFGVRTPLPPLGRFDISYAIPLKAVGFTKERPDPRVLMSFSTYFGLRAR